MIFPSLGAIVLLAFVMLASCATTSIRYSSNPIGKLAVLGIQISESVDAANRMLEDPFGKNFLKNIDWPLVIDPSYKQLKEAKAVTLSFNNEQAGGITCTSALLGDMAFAEDMPGFILVLDRAHRVRGCGRGFIMDGQRQDTVEREANRLVEDLLLNLDKSEKITFAEDAVQQQGIVSLGKKTVVGTDDPANFDFQTERNHFNGVGMTLQTARSISDNFARGEAGPGKTNVPNAHPDAE